MNISKKIALVVAILAILAGLGYLVFQPTIPKNNQADIQLTISGPPGNPSLKFTGASGHVGNCKPANNSPNCVRVAPNDTATMTFRLVGQDHWKFSQMQLVAGPPDIDPNDKLNFGPQTGFSQQMRDDFYVTIGGVDIHPDSNGIIKLNTSPGVGRDFILVDNNQLAQTYIYQLQVCRTKNGIEQCKDSDPRIENEGTTQR